jgi:hypothetical protein
MKNYINILLISIILFILFFKDNNNDNKIIIQDYLIASSNIEDEIKKNKIQIDKRKLGFIGLYDNRPEFRGLIKYYQKLDEGEFGGSKPFRNAILNDINETINIINFDKYGSYRRRPHIKDIKNELNFKLGKSTAIK